jgi:hypothetical protein
MLYMYINLGILSGTELSYKFTVLLITGVIQTFFLLRVVLQ